MWKLLVSSASLALLLFGCGGGSPNQAESTSVRFTSSSDGVTPFIKRIGAQLDGTGELASVSFEIGAQPGTISRPVHVTLLRSFLVRRGFFEPTTGQLTIPVFGLYAGASNSVKLTFAYVDGSSSTSDIVVDTAPYRDANGVYDRPRVLTARIATTPLGFDFMVLKSGLTTPVIVDTDGQTRWIGAMPSDPFSSSSSVFLGNRFLVGSGKQIYALHLDGGIDQVNLKDPVAQNFHHDVSPGKHGLLFEIDGERNGTRIVESLLYEADEQGNVLKTWDMGQIFTDAIVASGGDPSNFVRDGVDWFHMNSAVYDPRDDTLLVSSRENFVVKLDYETGQLKWLLGDPTKHWFVDYPALQALALTINGHPPIGQHALSISNDGQLLMFDNGLASQNHPAGTAAGANRNTSAPAMYRIDEQTRTATETWRFEFPGGISSPVCSSVYQLPNDSKLVTYSSVGFSATDPTSSFTTRLVGLTINGTVAFDFEYSNPRRSCLAAWNATPIAFDALTLD
ncbi:aryl-sulfate sulfotransferase [Chitinolyticbacter meiyuanensis]|uniref:aryl-sulfate sulfotransferase n=1 Tax=Chitinolyticbacter meiyuanensis TaxID=682798 RepID=UPI0011E5CF98|nr:aryl-sulfate sulfotransferase [Chitinolyticbacter meiyuanensis]